MFCNTLASLRGLNTFFNFDRNSLPVSKRCNFFDCWCIKSVWIY